jgi:hypothetical protein
VWQETPFSGLSSFAGAGPGYGFQDLDAQSSTITNRVGSIFFPSHLDKAPRMIFGFFAARVQGIQGYFL